MADESFNTVLLNHCLARAKAGDAAGWNDLYRAAGARLERLARKMLAKFPAVRRWEEADDLLHAAVLRLHRALGQMDVTSTRSFFGLAAEEMRRQLIDLYRHYYGPRGLGANHASGAAWPADAPPEPEAPEAPELDDWAGFHEAVERLPAEEREVVGLIFYHGWTQAEVAELFQVDVRTIQRRWRRAVLALHRSLGDGSPALPDAG